LVKSVMDMRMAPEASRGSQCICSRTPPSEATRTEPCSPAPGLALPANQPPAQVVTAEHVQQFLDIFKSLSTQQAPPPKSPDSAKAVEGAETDARHQPETAPASELEFKTVNEVYVSYGVIKLWLTIHLGGTRKSLSTRFRNLQRQK
jgi:hypothetical protein